MLQISVLLFIFLVVLSFLCVKYAYSFWRTRGFSQATPKFPYGNFEGAGQTVSVSQRLTSIYEEFKDKASVVGIYVFLSPSILVTDLEVIQHVLMKDFSNFHDRGFYYNIKDDPLSGILFAIEGQEWRQTRAKLTQSLTISKIKLMFNTIVNISEEMLEYLANQESPKELDLKELMNQLASDVIGNVALGLDTNCIKNSDNLFMKMGKKVFYLSPFRTIKMFVMSSYTNLARKLGMRFTDMDVEEFFLGSFRETLKYREENNIVRSDFMNTMIQFKKEAENDMHNEKSDDTLFNELAAQCYMIFVAGYETTSSTLSFCLYELAMNPNIQETLRQEIKKVLEKNDNKLTHECLPEMKYLQMVIDETLRKHPPGDYVTRKAITDWIVPKTELLIPKDTPMFIPIYSIHNDANYYPKPEKFDPERFNDENRKTRHPMTFLPFGGGPRNCVGVNFAYMEIKLVMVQLISRFKFSPSAKTTCSMEYSPNGFAMTPKNGVWLNVEGI